MHKKYFATFSRIIRTLGESELEGVHSLCVKLAITRGQSQHLLRAVREYQSIGSHRDCRHHPKTKPDEQFGERWVGELFMQLEVERVVPFEAVEFDR